ncbi:MAG: polyprenyl synthetase family protein [SAR324 cluster bacterium]|nr:polyprenyl synthetase family protein [SAR324 cluster bacterium]
MNQQKMTEQKSLKEILEPIQSHLITVEDLVMKNLETDIPLLTEVGQYILKAGGKRVRPALLLFSCGALSEISQDAYLAANIVEYIHTATLLHDDVVDNADLRRSKQSARSIWGNEASVLVGDYLFTVSFKSLATLKKMDLVHALSRCTTMMARGEILQLVRDNEDASEEEYLEIIHHKTASLMGVAMEMGAIIGGGDAAQVKALYEVGHAIGMAFQLVDDALDYQLENAALGKEQGTDLKERKITLPLSHLLQSANEKEKSQILDILDADEITEMDIALVAKMMDEKGSVAYTLSRAQDYIDNAEVALKTLPQNEYSKGIFELANFVISRNR